jgi:hypothetical protein
MPIWVEYGSVAVAGTLVYLAGGARWPTHDNPVIVQPSGPPATVQTYDVMADSWTTGTLPHVV